MHVGTYTCTRLWANVLDYFTNECIYFYSGKGGGLSSLASSQSVSFRQGSNVEFGGVAGAAGGEPAYTLEETPRKGRDFSNPMYDAVTRAQAAGEPEPPIREYHYITYPSRSLYIKSYMVLNV